MVRAVACPYFGRAFGWCVPIGGLGGLIGLGGGRAPFARPDAWDRLRRAICCPT